MAYSIVKVFLFLTPKQRKEFYFLQILVACSAALEVASISLIGPFIALNLNHNYLNEVGVFTYLFSYYGFSDVLEFIYYFGIMLFFILLITAVLSIYTMRALSMYGSRIGVSIGDRLYEFYLSQPLSYHFDHNSAQLIKQISTETTRLTDSVIIPLMQVNARIFLVLFIVFMLFFISPMLAILMFAFLGSVFSIIFFFIKGKLSIYGKRMSEDMGERYKLLSMGLGGIKDVLLLNKKGDLVNEFIDRGKSYSYARGVNHALATVPRYFVEFVTFVAILLAFLVFNSSPELRASGNISIAAIAALALLKMLPAMQLIFNNASHIKGNLAAFESIESDLNDAIVQLSNKSINNEIIHTVNGIELKVVSFGYRGSNYNVVENLNLRVSNNKKIGIVGYSGSGKSTLVNIILGALTTESGKVLYESQTKKILNFNDLKNIGYVPQNIFMFEGTIAQNVAFELDAKAIDFEKVKQVLESAHLKEFIDSLEFGINALVGERGVSLSGGQMQRIGIARALYFEPEILILDEATSALDGFTESAIVKSLNEISSGMGLLLVAHRLSTLKDCDVIYFLDNGKVILSGSFDEIRFNPAFEKLSGGILD